MTNNLERIAICQAKLEAMRLALAALDVAEDWDARELWRDASSVALLELRAAYRRRASLEELESLFAEWERAAIAAEPNMWLNVYAGALDRDSRCRALLELAAAIRLQHVAVTCALCDAQVTLRPSEMEALSQSSAWLLRATRALRRPELIYEKRAHIA